MANGDHNALVVKFAADLEALQDGIANVSKLLETKVEKQLDRSGEQGKKAAANIKGGFKDVGDGLRVVGVLLGEQSSAVVQIGTQLSQFVGTIGSSVASSATKITLIGGAIAAVGAGVYAIAKNWTLVKARTEDYWSSFKASAQEALAGFDDTLAKLDAATGGTGERARAHAAALRELAAANREVAEAAADAARKISAAKILDQDAAKAKEEYEKRTQALVNTIKSLGGSTELAAQHVEDLKAVIKALAASGDPAYAQEIQDRIKELKQAEATLKVLKGIDEDRARATPQTDQAKLIEAASAALAEYKLQSLAASNAASVLGVNVSDMEEQLRLTVQTMNVLAASGSENFKQALDDLGREYDRLYDKLKEKKLAIEFDEASKKRVLDGIAEADRKVKSLLDFKSQFSGPSAGLADLLLPEESIGLLSQRQEQIRAQFVEWYDSLRVTGEDFLQLTQSTVDQFTQGLGDAIARIVVYQEDVGKTFEALGKSLLASTISALVQMAAQWLIFFLFGQALLSKKTSAEIGAATAIAAAWAAAASVRELGLIGIAAAPAFSAAAAGITIAGATAGYGAGAAAGAGFGAAASGAYVTGPTMMLLGEHEPEVIAPRSQYEAMLEANHGGDGTTNIYLDGRLIASNTARHWPGVMRAQGIKGV